LAFLRLKKNALATFFTHTKHFGLPPITSAPADTRRISVLWNY